MNAYVSPIDLDLLHAEKTGVAIPPKNRHATEMQRNESAARDKRNRFVAGDAAEFPEHVPSVEDNMLNKGYTVGAVNEHMRDLAKHETEKNDRRDWDGA